MLQPPTEPGRQSEPQPSEFETALRKNEPVLSAANVTVRTPAVPVAFPGKPKVPEADRDRELIWTVGVSSVRFNLAELLAKPEVAPTTPLNAKNSIVRSVGSKLCMLARSTDSPSQFLFSADQADAYAVAITVSSIDVEPWARRSNAQRIPAQKLPPERLAPSTADKFARAAPDQVHEWGLEAIQKTDPHVVRLDYDAGAKKYRGTFPISADGRVTARLVYVREDTRDAQGDLLPDAGKFLVTFSPADPSRTLANLFDDGTVEELIVQAGPSEAEAETAEKITEKVVGRTDATHGLGLVTKTAYDADPPPLDTAATAYVRINFGLTAGVATGWIRKKDKDIALGAIKPGGLAVVQNGVLLVGDSDSVQVHAFKNRGRFPGVNITGTGFAHRVSGMAYNRTRKKLALTQGGYGEAIKVYTLLLPGTAEQSLGPKDTEDTIPGSRLAAGTSLAVWCVAWHNNDDLWVIDRSRYARVFAPGTTDRFKKKNVTLPGTEQIYAATFVGDVLLYGGGGSAVYAYNVVTDQPVPGLELTGLQVAADVSGFGTLNCMAYDPDAEILYLGGSEGYVVTFAASKDTTAFPEELYDHRTMSKTRLQEETLDAPPGDPGRAFKVVVSEQQPGGASEPRTLTDTQLKQALSPIVEMTQAEYDAKVAANTIADNVLYVIVG